MDDLYTRGSLSRKAKQNKRLFLNGDILNDATMAELLNTTRKWIEESTGLLHKDKTFFEYLSDGTVLCRLIQAIQPGLIKRTNRIKSPFAWRENICFFLEACRILGVKESQLFAPEDLYEESPLGKTSHKISSVQSIQERKLRKVCGALYYLGHKVANLTQYSGPRLESLSSDSYHPTQLKVPEDNKPQPNKSSKVKALVSPAFLSKAQERYPTVIRKVQSFTSLVPETITCTTEQQSFAEVHFCTGKKKNSENHHPGVRLTCSVEAFSCIEYLGATARSEEYKGIARTTSSGIPQSRAPDIHKVSSLQHLSCDLSYPENQSSPVSSCSTLVTPSCQKDLNSSQASTAVLQNTVPLSCSDTGSETDSNKLPLSDTSTDNSDKFHVLSLLSHSQPNAEEEIFLNNPFSPHHLSNSPVSKIDHTGILTAEHKFISNQDIFGSLNTSPEREETYHFSLTQKSEEPSPHVSLDHTNFRTPQGLKSFDSDSSLHGLSILSPKRISVVHTSEREGSDSVFSVPRSELSSKGQSSQSREKAKHSTVSDSVYPAGLVEAVTSTTKKSAVHCEPSLPASQRFSSSTSAHAIMSVVESQYSQESDNSSSYHSKPVNIPDAMSQGRLVLKDDINKVHVPHHNLILATSGPDSPSSYKVSRSQHTDYKTVGFTDCEVEMVLLPGEKRLGLNLVEDANSDVLLRVKAISEDSAAARSNLLCEDELLAVNGIPLQNTGLKLALNILQENLSSGRLTFRVRRAENMLSVIQHYKSTRPHDLLDMARVNSDALPYSQKPRTVQVPFERSESSTPDFLNSSIVNITSSTDELSHLPDNNEASHPHEDHHSEGYHNHELRDIQTSSDNLVKTIDNPAAETICTDKFATQFSHSKNPRPISAPTKSLSSSVLISNKAHTLPTSMSDSDPKSVQKKQELLDKERKRRSSSIQASAQVLLKYSQKRKYSQTGSLPREYQSLSHIMFDLGDEVSSGDTNIANRRPSSPELALSLNSSSSISTAMDEDNSSSTPLNLRHISMDETRVASLIHMDNIWRQVESGDDSPNPSGRVDDSTINLLSQLAPEASGSVDCSDSVEMENNGKLNGDQYRDSQDHIVNNDTASTQDIITESEIIISVSDSHSTSFVRTPSETNQNVPQLSSHQETRERSTSFSNKGIDSLLSTLKSLSSTEEDGDDLRVLEDMLKSSTFMKAKQVHDQMHQLLSNSRNAPKPIIRRIVPSTQLMRQRLYHNTIESEEVEELRSLLRSPHIQALMFCHDKVSTGDLYVPDTHFHKTACDPVDIILSGSVCHFQAFSEPPDVTVPLSREVPSSRKEGAIVIFIERTNKPLGVTVYKQEEYAFIGKLQNGCDAEASDVLREGDELLEVNGFPVWSKSIVNIVSLLSSDSTHEGETLVLTIIPLHDDTFDLEYEPKYIRSHFNYNGRLDEEIPCKSLGLSFRKGDILEISNQDDPNWWQARKIFDDGAESLPGLIPSRHLQQQREAMVRSYPFSFTSKKKGFGSLFSKKKKKKVFYHNTSTSGSFGVGDEVPTYEEVVRLNPNQCPNRPIILIGAPGVGRRALIRELINSEPSRFSSVVPHTCRSVRSGEIDGQDYFFVTKEEFESDIHRDRFLEYGEYKGSYYGTGFMSIKKIMESSKVPVVDVHPQALKKLRYSELQPYVIFVASPRMERLQFTRKTVTDKTKKPPSHSSFDDSHTYTEYDLRRMVEESLLIENQYGHYFDWIIVNDDFQVASDMLKEVVRRVEEEPQWIPALWKYDKL